MSPIARTINDRKDRRLLRKLGSNMRRSFRSKRNRLHEQAALQTNKNILET